MLTGKFIKIDRIIENVHRDYGFDNLDWIHCIEWIGECLDGIGAPQTYIEKNTDGNEKLGHPEHIKIEGNRGVLPCDLHQIIQCFNHTSGSTAPMRMSTDSTHLHYGCHESPDYGASAGNEYKLNNGFIFTDFAEGYVMMSYRANPTDERGYPMLPENIKFIKACQAYIADKVLFKKQIQGKAVSGAVVQKIEQDLHWYTGAANTAARIPTIDQMESWKNQFIKLIPAVNSHAGAFANDGRSEKRVTNSMRK